MTGILHSPLANSYESTRHTKLSFSLFMSQKMKVILHNLSVYLILFFFFQSLDQVFVKTACELKAAQCVSLEHFYSRRHAANVFPVLSKPWFCKAWNGYHTQCHLNEKSLHGA